MNSIDINIERAVKAIVNWNGQEVKFNTSFLKLQDNFDLIIEKEDDETLVFKTKIKK